MNFYNNPQPQPNINLKQFYKNYKLVVWLGIAYAASLAVTSGNIFTIIYYSYLVVFTGRLFYDLISKKDFIHIWIGSFLLGGIIYSLYASAFENFPWEGVAVAAMAAGSLGLLAAAATYMPDAPMRLFFFGSFPFKYLAIGLIVLDIFSAGSDVQEVGRGVSHFAHIAGVAVGFAYIYFRQKGYDTERIFRFFTYSRRPRMKAKKGGKQKYNKTQFEQDEDYNKRKADEQEQIDKILDKVSKSGYESLTKEEKELLFRQSKD